MGNFFGIRSRRPVVTAQDRAILQLKQQRDKIKIYQRKTNNDLVKNKQLAVQLYNNNLKERALITLRMSKCMEDILIKTDNQLKTLEQMVRDIEFRQIEVSVVEGLRVGTESLKQLTDLMNIENISQMMEENAEATQKQQEISAILEQSAMRYDEDDLLKELATYTTKEDVTETKEPEQTSKEPEPVIKVPEPAAKQAVPVALEAETTTTEKTERKTEEPPSITSLEAKLDDLPEVPQAIPEEPIMAKEPSKPKRELVTEAL